MQTKDGGKPMVKPTSYSPPKGPKNINDPQSPGLHGNNYGNGCMPSPRSGEGKTSISGTTSRNGTQR